MSHIHRSSVGPGFLAFQLGKIIIGIPEIQNNLTFDSNAMAVIEVSDFKKLLKFIGNVCDFQMAAQNDNTKKGNVKSTIGEATFQYIHNANDDFKIKICHSIDDDDEGFFVLESHGDISSFTASFLKNMWLCLWPEIYVYTVIQKALEHDDIMHELLVNCDVNSDLPITKFNGKCLNCLQALQVTAFTNEHRKLLKKCTEIKKKLSQVLRSKCGPSRPSTTDDAMEEQTPIVRGAGYRRPTSSRNVE